MKTVTIVISALAVGGLVLGGLSACSQRFKTPEGRADHIVKKITKKLELNETQVAKLDVLKNEILTVRKEMKGKKENTHKSLREILGQPKLDQTRVMSIFNGHVKDINKQAPRVVAALGGFWDSLTPEQQTKIREKMEKHMSRHGRWGHGHGYGH